MNKKSFLRPFLLIGFIIALFISCDKDFDQLGTNIVGDDLFGATRDVSATINATNQELGPVASNNLPVNPFGFYNNPAFGNTQANFVTQLEMASANPTFNNTDQTLYQLLPAVDSVIVEIPYFVNRNITTNTDGTRLYTLDSIFGEKVADDNSKFKLSVYQSNYYLRDYDPSQSFEASQLFYTDKDAEIDANKIPVLLNDNTTKLNENSQFFFDNREHKTMTLDASGNPVYARSVPSMRLHLNTDIFYNKIINAPSGQLANNSVFKNYFRGLYFKAESIGNTGNMAMLNFKGGKVTIYYQEDNKTTTTNGSTTNITYPRVKKTFVLNLTGNTVSLQNNLSQNANYLSAIQNNSNNVEKLYLKGGQGSVAYIDLFGGSDPSKDLYRYDIKKNTDGKPVDENGNIIPLDTNGNPINTFLIYVKTNTPNGVSDELDDLRYPNISTDTNNPSIYYSKKNRRLINEANLVFYVDVNGMSNAKTFEPNRLFLFDVKNKKTLVDYTSDFTTNGVYPKYNKYVFGGLLENSDGTLLKQIRQTDGSIAKGYRYKIRITNHIRNLIRNDSTNVRLGLSVTESINNITFSKRKNPGSDAVISIPSMSVANPLGTILYGTNLPVTDEKRLKLEIYYTKPY
jgi:hypothetical protein